MTTRTGARSGELSITAREREFIVLAARGLGNQEIADALHLSQRTVKSTMHRACLKLGAHTRYRAVVQALKLHLVTVEDVLTEDEIVELLASARPETINRVTQKALSRALNSQLMTNSAAEGCQIQGA